MEKYLDAVQLAQTAYRLQKIYNKWADDLTVNGDYKEGLKPGEVFIKPETQAAIDAWREKARAIPEVTHELVGEMMPDLDLETKALLKKEIDLNLKGEYQKGTDDVSKLLHEPSRLALEKALDEHLQAKTQQAPDAPTQEAGQPGNVQKSRFVDLIWGEPEKTTEETLPPTQEHSKDDEHEPER